MAPILELPDELLASLFASFPCREAQINALTTFVHPRIAPCRNIIVHGTEATGKCAITRQLLDALSHEPNSDLSYAIVKSPECVTARHLFERTVGLVSDALQNETPPGRCETLAALTVELSKLLKYVEQEPGRRFVLVFDGIDRQRDAPPTLLPALARLSEIIPNLTTIFILTTPLTSMLRISAPQHIHFPAYTKPQYLTILSLDPPSSLPNTTAQETHDLYTRFVAAVHDALAAPAARTLPRLRQCCATLWPRFTAPVAAGTHKAREFSKLLIASRAYFQDESILEPGIQRVKKPSTANIIVEKKGSSTTDLSALLPPTAKHLLLAAYLASHNAPRFDVTLFSTWHASASKRRKRGGVSGANTGGGSTRGRKPKHRRIARKLLGPGVFVLERMVAIYVATKREWIDGGEDVKSGVDGDVGMAIATLVSLRLLVRVGGAAGGADLDRSAKWRVNVGWEVVRGVGRSMGVEVEEWLIE
ncbi:origin recognition complex subunit Orc5 [Xylariaceae sp. FL1019]|nr:origin recognition complex subunit Orc5 [Xylariaceae sp. FL1019]